MPRNDRIRRYFEAAAVLGEITRARGEELVREFMSGGDVQRSQAQQWVDELVDRSRKAAQDLLDLVRTEVSKQMQTRGLDPEDLARQAAEILHRSAEAGRRVMHDAGPGTGGSKKTSPKKAAAKKAAGGAKKSATKKAGGSKVAAAKKSSTAKAGGPKKAAAKKATAKKAAAKKATAKKATAKKRAAPARAPTR